MIRNKTFLLVDDDADDAATFREALDLIASSVEFHTIENGLKLFEILSQYRPDVIFLDINMPLISGWECLEKLKNDSKYSDIPVIMYSTSLAKRDIDKAFSLGAFLFVTKPERFAELSKILEIVATYPQDAQVDTLKEFASVKVN